MAMRQGGNSGRTTEHALTLGIRQLLNMHRIWHFKHWGGPMGEKGVSDIIGCKDGRMIAIEIKTPAGKVTPYQQRFIDRVNAAGGIGFVARSIEDVIEGLGLKARMLL